jgi:hypothetical protein
MVMLRGAARSPAFGIFSRSVGEGIFISSSRRTDSLDKCPDLAAAPRYRHTSSSIQKQGSIMGSVLAGVVLISIGLFGGDSIFRGEFTITSVLFDGLGLFWLGKGIFGMVKQRTE